MDRWLVLTEDKNRLGPLTLDELANLHLDGKLGPGALFCIEGANSWLKLSENHQLHANILAKAHGLPEFSDGELSSGATSDFQQNPKISFLRKFFILLSASWLLVIGTIALSESEFEVFAALGIGPLMFCWGFWWVFKGIPVSPILRRGVFWFSCSTIFFGISAALYYGVQEYQKTLPRVMGELAGLKLGMSPVEVKLLKGNPEPQDGPILEDGKYSMRWSYDSYSGDVNLKFYGDSKKNLALSIICSENYRDEIFGIGVDDRESVLTKKLGEPQITSIVSSGLAKFISYPDYKVAFMVSKGTIDQACISNSGQVVFSQEYEDS